MSHRSLQSVPSAQNLWAGGRWLIAITAISILAACGGGGGSSAPTPAPVAINAAPTNVRLIEVSSASPGTLNVSWLPASDDATPAASIKYQVHASTDAGFTPAAATLMFEGTGVVSASITSGLTAGISYAVRLVAIDGSGAATTSDSLQVMVSNTAAKALAGAQVRQMQASQVSAVTANTVVLQAGVAAPAAGTFVSSADANGGSGYLRKVVSVAQANGVTTLQTQPASINEVVSDIQVSSTFKMDTIPSEVAATAVQAGLAVAGDRQGDSTSHVFSWPQTGLRYATGVQAAAISTPLQLGVVAPVNNFAASQDQSKTGSYGKVSGNSHIEIAEGSKGSSQLILSVINESIPILGSAVGVCKVELGAMQGTGTDSNPAGVVANVGTFDKIQTVAESGRVKVAYQALNFLAVKGTATDKPYKVIATAFFDDVGGNCNPFKWREKIDFELEIFVTADSFPVAEAVEKTFAGSAGFSVKNNIATTFAPKVSFDKTLSGASLTYARMGVQASPRVVQTLTIEATAQGTMDKTLEIINPRKFFKVYVTPAGIPIVVSGVLRMDMRIKGDVSGGLKATEKLTIGYDDIRFGVEYKNGQFVPFQAATPVYKLNVAGDGKAEANLTISLLPSLELTGYEVLTGKAVLEPYMTASAGVEGHVTLDAEVDFDAAQTNMAADADYRLTKTRLAGGVNAWLYADLHVWDTKLLVWPEPANIADYKTYRKVELLPETTIMDLPTLNAFLPTGSGTIYQSDSCAIKVRANADNVPNPFTAIFPNGQPYIAWQRWTAPRIIAPLGTPADSYSFLPDPNNEAGVFWARITKPGIYTVRVGGYSNLGTWARQYTEVRVDATDGRTNLQGLRSCALPVVFGTINAAPAAPTVLQNIAFWVTDAYQTVKSVLWNFGVGIADQTAAVANNISAAVSQAFSTSGLKTVTATFKDAAGNILGQSTTTVTVAAVAIPTASITAATSDSANQPGAIANNGSTDDTTPTLRGTISAALTFDGQKVNVYDGATRYDAPAVVSGTTWTFTPATALIGGSHSFTVSVGTFDANEGVRSAPFVVNVLSTKVTSIAPGEIVRTVSGTFDVVGRDLPTSGLAVTVPGDARASCQGPTGLSSSGFKIACQFYKLGSQILEIRSGTQLLGTAAVSVKTNVTGVTWTSPSTTNSGSVQFREQVTFSVAGVNLLSDTTMGFAVEKCGVSNVEIGTPSNTVRTFTCNWNDQAGAVVGQMPGVVKDAPGGQVLFDGWNVPVGTASTSTVNIPATAFVRGTSVALSANGYGTDTLMNAPPYGPADNSAEWDIVVPATGQYELFATYASAESRPVTIAFNGVTAFATALSASTGGLFPANRQILSQGFVQLTAGTNVMRVSESGANVFPHIQGFSLVLKTPTNFKFFDAFDGTSLDTTKWTLETASAPCCGVGNAAAITVADSFLNVAVNGGSCGFCGTPDGTFLIPKISPLSGDFEMTVTGEEIERLSRDASRTLGIVQLLLAAGSTHQIGIYSVGDAISNSGTAGHLINMYSMSNNVVSVISSRALTVGQYYAFQFRARRVGEKTYLAHRISSDALWTEVLVTQSMPSSLVFVPKIGFTTGDGGGTRVNSSLKARLDSVTIE